MTPCEQPGCLCWQWTGDTAEDTAKRVADSYRTILRDLAMGHRDDPAGDTHRQDQFWQAHGIEWHLGHTHLPLETDAWMTATDIATHIAHLTNITPRTIHQWHYRGHITTRTAGDGSPRYNVGEVIAYAASRRRKHAG